MKENTIVSASDSNYIWGVFMLIASIRKSGMDEPIIILGKNYTDKDCKILQQFSDVTIFEAKPSERSMACSKAEAMLHAKTPYITWVDCDGFFTGNVSKYLIPPTEDLIHIRMRGELENALSFAKHNYGENGKSIPQEVLEAWEIDIDNSDNIAKISRCCSDCFLSIHKSQIKFLEAWDKQMKKVIPANNNGVVDNASKWYHSTDESVLNSLLCFYKNAPKVTDVYEMDKNKDALFVHFVCHPKPWKSWTNYSYRYFDSYCDIVEYILKLNLNIPNNKVPLSLNKRYKLLNYLLIYPTTFYYKLKKLFHLFNTFGIK